MKKLFQKAEAALGIDLDGDGHVGKPKPQGSAPTQQQGGYGGGGQGAYGQPQQQPYGGAPSGQPYGGAPSGQPYGGAPGGQQQPPYGGMPPQQTYGQQQQAYGQQPVPGQGNKKALLIGINYVGQKGQLSGCVNDVKTMKALLQAKGFTQGSYQEVVLVDDRSIPGGKMPTKAEIMGAFQWLASNNRPGDTLFFHYSGHGGQQKDRDGDEEDGYDETLIPVDYKTAGQITDDDIFRYLVAPLPAGVRMTAIMDCCHSGTAMDLPYLFRANEGAMKQALLNPAEIAMCLNDKKKLMKLGMQLLQGGGLGALLGGGKKPAGGGGGGGTGFQTDGKKQCNADVVMFSGCGDSQTSADVSNVQSFGLPANAGPGGAGGACTNAFASVMHKNQGNLQLVQLLEQMRVDLKSKKYTQVPQLSSSKPVSLAAPFSFFGPLQQSQAAPVQAAPGYGQPMQGGQYRAGPPQQQAYPPQQQQAYPPQQQQAYPPQQQYAQPHGQYPQQYPPQQQYQGGL